MKKLFIIFLFATSICSAQSFGVKLANPKTVTVVPAKVQQVDSVYVRETIEWSHGMAVSIELYSEGQIVFDKQRFVLWEGAEYDPNKDYTRSEKKARIKFLLSQ